MKRSTPVLALLALATLATATTACGRRGDPGANIPDEETFYMSLPEDEGDAGSTQTQAECVDTGAYDALKERILVYNAAIQARIALIKLMIRAADRAGGGQLVDRTASRNGFTAELVAEDDGAGSVGYTVTLTDPDGNTTTLLDGTSASDLTSGSWDFQGLTQNRAVHVDWTHVDGTLTVDRTATGDFGTRTSHYVRTDTDADVTFSGPNHDATAHWNRDTKDGSIIVDGNETCWDAADDLSDFCNVPCDAGEGEGEGEGE